MSVVTDQELLQFHYRDGLEPARIAEIEDVLFFDAELRLRLAGLRESLALVTEAWPQAQADADFEARVWARLQPTLPARSAQASAWQRLQAWIEPLRPAQVAFASLLIAALGVGYLLGRQPMQAGSPDGVSLLADDASSRVLSAYLAAHLEDAERALLVASHSPDDAAAAQQLAIALLDSNRLYALAAERAGKPALGQFLRELEPVLIELSNEHGAVAPALGEQIRSRDLAYKTRAAAALARNEFAVLPQSL